MNVNLPYRFISFYLCIGDTSCDCTDAIKRLLCKLIQEINISAFDPHF